MNELQIASTIQNYVTAGEGVTSSVIELEQIRDEVDTLRMRTVQELDRNRALIPEAYYQVLEGSLVKTTPITTGKYRGWTEISVPSIYTNLKGKPQIQYVGPANEAIPNRVSVGNQHLYLSSNRFTDKYPLAVVDANSIKFKEAYKVVTIKALFEDPSALEEYDCYDHENDIYPAPQGDIDAIIGKTAESYIRTQQLRNIQPNIQVDLPSNPQR